MNLVAAALAPLLLGALLLRALGLRWRNEPVAWPAWAWLAGCLLLGAAVQLGLELRVPPASFWTLPLGLAVLLGAVALRRRPAAPGARAPAGAGFTAFVVAGALWCLLFAASGMDRPCIEGDEGNIWSLKAKSLLVDWPDGFALAQVHNLHPDYPQLNPLLQAWTFALLGGPDSVHFENRWLVQLAGVALFVALAAALRRRLPALPAAALAALLPLSPVFQELLRTAYADGMVALGLVVALDGFLRWREHGDRRALWLAGLGLAFAAWSKNETMLYLASAAAAALLLRAFGRLRPTLRDLAPLAPLALVVANTTLWNGRFGLHSDLFGANPTGKSMFVLMAQQWQERVPALAAEFAAAVTSPAQAHVVFGLLLLGALLRPRRASGPPLALPFLALFGGLLGLHVVYVGSFLPLRFHLDTSYLRVTFQLLPAALVLLAALLADVVGARGARHDGGRP
ncbi:MAG: hypothetical protein FJ265_18540 [Planctomycetes bacterium]|nr:hypothetical protein [Planctomycetota bacterium]